MAAAPLPPMPASAPASEPAPLSEGARIVDTFIAPSKTFTDLRRSAAWWGPFLLISIFSIAFFYVVGQKIGFRKVVETQIQSSPKASARVDQLPAGQRDQALERQAKGTQYFGYGYPLLLLLINLIISALLFATFKFAAGATIKFKAAFAIVMYAGLPGILRATLAIVSIMAGANADSFSLQNPVATNPAYFMTQGESPFLYSLMSSLDVFLIWTLILTAIGFTCVGKVKRGTSFAIVFGWWIVFTLIGASIGAAFS
ncbi:MAG TPA: YIP1 family protein [Candidatus Sulfotelmatobacter sp.]